ncbi:MAG: hypothetical protein IRY94_09075 [Rhodospirillaceae bacterium]|nr:hypothetical protein [Rhodospirillaceae bacterium]
MEMMPIEVRHILFDETEVQAALVAYHRRRVASHRQLSVAELRIEDYPQLRGFLSFLDQDGQLEVAEFGRVEMAAALILHCRQLRVPLPAKATKELRVYGQRGLCLTLSLNAPPSLAQALAPH